MAKKTATMGSRAVRRLIEPGNNVVCAKCTDIVKFATREQARQVIANVYEGGKWVRVEYWHDGCYQEAAQPYGPAA